MAGRSLRVVRGMTSALVLVVLSGHVAGHAQTPATSPAAPATGDAAPSPAAPPKSPVPLSAAPARKPPSQVCSAVLKRPPPPPPRLPPVLEQPKVQEDPVGAYWATIYRSAPLFYSANRKACSDSRCYELVSFDVKLSPGNVGIDAVTVVCRGKDKVETTLTYPTAELGPPADTSPAKAPPAPQ